MSKYYKADEVKKWLSCGCAYVIWELPTIEIDEDCISREQAINAYYNAGDVYKALKSLPSITPKEYTDIDDFVEVVRCKDCKYSRVYALDSNEEPQRWCTAGIVKAVDDDDYCSWGE